MPDSINIRFYEELNDFIHHTKRKKTLNISLPIKRTIKDVIEAQGVPHTEVDLILANGKSVTFNYHPSGGDLISVYPVFESLDITPLAVLRPKPLRKTRFILDVHLGVLAKYLRMLGFDSYYRNNLDDREIINLSLAEKRIILTRDLFILKNGKVTHGYYVRETSPKRQLTEVVQRFDLKKQVKPFSRCMECNGTIVKVDKKTVEAFLKPNTRLSFNEFYRCRSCKKVYWEGSHHKKMKTLMGMLVGYDDLAGHVQSGC